MSGASGPEFESWAEHKRRTFPPVLYVPAGPPSFGGSPQVEVLATKDKRLALVVYTALDRLLDSCGDEQPWLMIKAEDLNDLRRTAPYDVIYLDLQRPGRLRCPPTEDEA